MTNGTSTKGRKLTSFSSLMFSENQLITAGRFNLLLGTFPTSMLSISRDRKHSSVINIQLTFFAAWSTLIRTVSVEKLSQLT